MFKLFAIIALSATSILLGDYPCNRAAAYIPPPQNYQSYGQPAPWGNPNFRQYNRPTGNLWTDPDYYNRQYQPVYPRDISPYYHPPGYWSSSTEMVIPL